MLKMRGNKITMSRGDFVCFAVDLRDVEGEEITLREGDALYFSAKKKETDVNYAIPPKKLDGNVLTLYSEDTYDLKFDTYLYDIQLVTKEGRTSTVVKPTPLVIEETVTAYGDR